MKELPEGAINQLLQQLDQGLVSQHNFELRFNNADGTIASISFRDDPKYYFKILYPQSEENQSSTWRTLESPGHYFTTEESYDHRDFATAFSRIQSWVIRLIEDLAVAKNSNHGWIKELRENLEATAKSLPNPKTPFSEAEVEEWKEKFDIMLERLEELEKENSIQRGFVEQLRRQLEQLATKGTEIPKRIWLKTAGHKILDVFEHGAKAGIKTVVEAAVKAMLEHAGS